MMSAFSYNYLDFYQNVGHRPANHQNSFVQSNLVSDGFVPAAHMDPNLINPWGLAHSRTGPFWVADNGTGVTTVYDGAGHPISVAGHSSITVAAPAGETDPSSPTGLVFNNTHAGFKISSHGRTAPAAFIFSTEDGTISGWNPGVDSAHSVITVNDS